ncbi:MAG: acetate kinase [Gammaproteobacteria bacterium]|nr:MAG: acetate kinase [Gammaproteobacteria bacterium]
MKTKPHSVLVINCGSSSLKFSLINPADGINIIDGIAERLMTSDAKIIIKFHHHLKNNTPFEKNLAPPFDHKTAIEQLVNCLTEHQLVDQISAVGHRVVHGGEKYSQPTLITPQVAKTIDELAKLAPLHNPANLIGITAAQKAFRGLPQVAVFDTAFHQTMPEKAYIYALPYALYQEHSIRKYGFHGTSHYFVSKQCAKQMNKPIEQCHFISAHLGNGCSVTAIKNGQSIDSSMGFTPLEGVMMGTRSGSIDPGIIFYLVEQLGYSLAEVNNILNKESGLLGVSQLSNDCRSLEKMALNNDSEPKKIRLAKLALNVFCYQIAKSIASLSAGLNQLDALIFTGGIGENSAFVRRKILKQLSLLNFNVDDQANDTARFGASGNICQQDSRPCWVIPTNEEWVIAQQSSQLLKHGLKQDT